MTLRVKSARLKDQLAMVKEQVKRQEQHIAIDGLETENDLNSECLSFPNFSNIYLILILKLDYLLCPLSATIFIWIFFLYFSKSYIIRLRAENALHFVFDCFMALTVSTT